MNLSVKRILTAGLIVAMLASVFVAGCGKKDEMSGQLVSAGSTALQPLVDEAAKQFTTKHPSAQITVNPGGSGAGLTQVSDGSVQIGNSDIFANEKSGIDASALEDHKVCVVGFATVVNPAVGVDSVTQQQLIDLFTGKITNWKQLGGADVAVNIISRSAGSGTRATFTKYALLGNGEKETNPQDSSGTVRQMVAQTPGAISYLALSYVDSSIKALKMDGVEPSVANICSGQYPVWSYEHMYTKGAASGLAKGLIDYILSDEVQKTLVPQLGYIPITDMKTSR